MCSVISGIHGTPWAQSNFSKLSLKYNTLGMIELAQDTLGLSPPVSIHAGAQEVASVRGGG